MSLKIAIVTSEFNSHITEQLLKGALEKLIELGVSKESITSVTVPGAVEIPLVVKKFAKLNRYDAIIALGAVIRGETSHYDYVCKQVSDGCQRIMLDFDIPVIFGVLTTENDEQAYQRVGGSEGHKGKEAAEAAIHIVNLLRTIA